MRTASLWRERLVSIVSSTQPGGTCVMASAHGYGASTILGAIPQMTGYSLTRLTMKPGEGPWSALAVALGQPGDAKAETILDVLEARSQCWLVVDDPYGVAHDDLFELAEVLPANARLAIATHRTMLTGPALLGRVLEISEDLLKFRVDEAVELLDGLDLDIAEAVWSAADGWLAAMLSTLTPVAQASGDVVWWLNGPGAQRLFHSWFEEVSDSTRDFLLATAVIDDLEVDICNSVVGRYDSASVLEALTREHAFLSAVADTRTSRWRRHPLLTSFLRQRGEHTLATIESHSRAAEWFRDHDDVESTMRHLLAAGRTEDAGQFLREHEADLFRWGKATTAMEWYGQLPRDALGDAAQRVLRVAWGHAYSAQVEDAEMWLARLRSLVADPPDTDPAASADEVREQSEREVWLEGETDTLEAYIASFPGDAHRMQAAASRAVAAFDAGTDSDSEQLSQLLLVKALQWSGDLSAARNQLHTVEHRRFANDMIRESMLATLKARQLRLEGRIHHAFLVADRARRWIETLRLNPLEMRLVNVTSERAAVLLERGDVAAAQSDLQVALRAQHSQHRSGDAATSLIELARALWVGGDIGATLRYLQQARSLLTLNAPDSPLLSAVDAAEARVRIGMGDGVRAERLVRSLPRGEERTLLWSRLSLARGGDMRRTLLNMEPSTARSAAELHLLRGWAMRRRGMRVAQAHLLEAADLCMDSGQALLLVDAAPEVRALVEEVALRHSHDGLMWLLSIVQQEAVKAAPVSSTLSPGEMRLISMLPTRYTISEIGAQLFVTENTVKTRLRRLYRKLDVNSRDEAISVARDRGLL